MFLEIWFSKWNKYNSRNINACFYHSRVLEQEKKNGKRKLKKLPSVPLGHFNVTISVELDAGHINPLDSSSEQPSSRGSGLSSVVVGVVVDVVVVFLISIKIGIYYTNCHQDKNCIPSFFLKGGQSFL